MYFLIVNPGWWFIILIFYYYYYYYYRLLLLLFSSFLLFSSYWENQKGGFIIIIIIYLLLLFCKELFLFFYISILFCIHIRFFITIIIIDWRINVSISTNFNLVMKMILMMGESRCFNFTYRVFLFHFCYPCGTEIKYARYIREYHNQSRLTYTKKKKETKIRWDK